LLLAWPMGGVRGLRFRWIVQRGCMGKGTRADAWCGLDSGHVRPWFPWLPLMALFGGLYVWIGDRCCATVRCCVAFSKSDVVC
jgi:hypothetical protein